MDFSKPVHNDELYHRRNGYIGQRSLTEQFQPSQYSYHDQTVDNDDENLYDSSSSEDETITNPWQHSVERNINEFSHNPKNECSLSENDFFSYNTRNQQSNYADRYRKQLSKNEIEAEERRRQLLDYHYHTDGPSYYNLRSQQPTTSYTPYELFRKREEEKRNGNTNNLDLLRQRYEVLNSEPFDIPVLKFRMDGSNIVFINFRKCLNKIQRKNMRKFIIEYIKIELDTKLTWKDKELVVVNYNNINNIQKCFEKYIDDYVRCKRCRSYDTNVNITKNSRRKFYITHCKKCKSIFPIKHSKEI
ncbi:hypothetical protein HOK00_01725 [bacterium]|nr:hypothetical protein [bacterium]